VEQFEAHLVRRRRCLYLARAIGNTLHTVGPMSQLKYLVRGTHRSSRLLGVRCAATCRLPELGGRRGKAVLPDVPGPFVGGLGGVGRVAQRRMG
jgi:hypothetical protein